MIFTTNIFKFQLFVVTLILYHSFLEYAEKGCLYDYLAKGPSTDFHQVLQWSQQIALGMNYLHCEAPAHVIHRDLKSRNSKGCHSIPSYYYDIS